MSEIAFPKGLTIDQYAERERDCWELWSSMQQHEKEALMKTIRSELLRLADTVENWLPASAGKNNGRFEVLIALFPDEIERKSPPLSNLERDAAAAVMENLAVLLDELEDSNA